MCNLGTVGYLMSILGINFTNTNKHDTATTKHNISVSTKGMNELLETAICFVVDQEYMVEMLALPLYVYDITVV